MICSKSEYILFYSHKPIICLVMFWEEIFVFTIMFCEWMSIFWSWWVEDEMAKEMERNGEGETDPLDNTKNIINWVWEITLKIDNCIDITDKLKYLSKSTIFPYSSTMNNWWWWRSFNH